MTENIKKSETCAEEFKDISKPSQFNIRLYWLWGNTVAVIKSLVSSISLLGLF